VKKRQVTKAQAAIEFLITYGWVVLFIIMIIGALAYFGVFDVSRFTPNKCEISSGFTCVDYKIASNAIILQIKNSAGTDFYISRLNYSRNGELLCSWPLNSHMDSGDVYTFTTFCNVGTASAKQSIYLDLEYYKSPLSRHVAIGEISYAVEGVYGALSDEEICQRAQDGDICCTLDLFFGPNTKQKCCSDYYPLCCNPPTCT
jgi:uncharacterized protein (UPF0333 family)